LGVFLASGSIATEPYRGGKGHGLWQLNELNNIDKHQLLIPAAAFNHSVDLSGMVRRSFREMGVPVSRVDDIMPPTKMFAFSVDSPL
jgi:hypothetical protein